VFPCTDCAGTDVYAELVCERCGKLLLAEAGTASEGLEGASFGGLFGVSPLAGVLA